MLQPPLPTAHDLPPRWDGRRVEWRGWQQAPTTTLRFHLPPQCRCCTECGSLDAPHLNRGAVWALPVEGLAPPGDDVVLALVETARRQAAQAAGRPVGQLFALRCPDCHHDQIGDDRGQWWDLGDSDYGDDGSVG